ncbi:MAG: putative Prepilin peptidase [Candidatus Saccharibacteria bacterium]|nr:putative Prepilin peptidase [Candidatus Saccharibacteria bacterium]
MVILVLIVLGLCLGSFAGATVWRLHQQALPAKKRVASVKDLSITTGRSMCPHCQHTLGVGDLLPLVSWLMLRGRCRYCKQSIGWQEPLMEAGTAVLFVLSYLFWPFAFDGRGLFLLGCWLLAVVGLVALLVYDLRWMLLPNKIVFPLIGLGVVQAVVVCIFFDGGISYALNAAAAVIVAGGIFWLLFQVSDGKWIGGGDVKLGYALGLFLARPSLAFLMLFTASILGVVAALPGLVAKKVTATSRIPFGPFLIVATIVVMLFGQSIVDWYANFVLQLP